MKSMCIESSKTSCLKQMKEIFNKHYYLHGHSMSIQKLSLNQNLEKS
jgi:hypothetical protein